MWRCVLLNCELFERWWKESRRNKQFQNLRKEVTCCSSNIIFSSCNTFLPIFQSMWMWILNIVQKIQNIQELFAFEKVLYENNAGWNQNFYLVMRYFKAFYTPWKVLSSMQVLYIPRMTLHHTFFITINANAITEPEAFETSSQSCI